MAHKPFPFFKRAWKFASLIDGHIHYLLADGRCVSDPSEAPNFIGLDNEADKEAERRCELHEDACGGIIERVTYESQGKVDVEIPIPAGTPQKAMPPCHRTVDMRRCSTPPPEQEELQL